MARKESKKSRIYHAKRSSKTNLRNLIIRKNGRNGSMI